MAKVNITGGYQGTGLIKKQLENTVKAVFSAMNSKQITVNKDINIVFVESDEIRKLNKEYRGKDASTDILTFDYGDEGDILLNLDLIRKLKEFDESMPEATLKTVIHGVLHLYGYDHENEKDRAIMGKQENKIWEKIK